MASHTMPRPFRLLDLPEELVEQILLHLHPLDLASAARSCRQLYNQSNDDRIWKLAVNDQLLEPISSPSPAKSFKELYIAHHPYWFLVKQRVWFSDAEPHGKLILTRYNPANASIMGHAVAAIRGAHMVSVWEKAHDVYIHSFEPQVILDYNVPILRLEPSTTKVEGEQPNASAKSSSEAVPFYAREAVMDVFNDPGVFSAYMSARILPAEAISHGTSVWPPQRFPSVTRTRNSSSSHYNSIGHKPTKYSELSQSTFRVRKWAEYSTPPPRPSRSSTRDFLSNALGMHGFSGMSLLHHQLRRPEQVTTFATIPPSCLFPTPEKPYQGVWCGDYSGHGCEFLVIHQPDPGMESPLPEGMDWLADWFAGGGRRRSSDSERSFMSAEEDFHLAPTSPVDERMRGFLEIPHHRTVQEVTDVDYPPTGRLEAIKLTGDENIPRAEYTFIAPDIGHGGFIRVADEEIFRGARIVRSAGHIAGDGFQEDQYTPSQLIMISHNRLAQFWEGFGHISYFERVDLDALSRLPF